MPDWSVALAPWLIAAALPLLAFALAPAATARAPRSPEPVAAHTADRPARIRAPRALVTRIERDLALAGLTGRWPLARVVLAKNALGGGVLVLGVLVLLATPSLLVVLATLLVAGVAYCVPDVVVTSRARERQARIQRELPDTLDQITITVEAGLSLESALARAGRHGSGPLAEELTRTIQDTRVGFSRHEAYTALAERTTSTDLKRFARAIMQADAYGVPVGRVVRMQAAELRCSSRSWSASCRCSSSSCSRPPS
jgi:tight adherence protein C